LVLFFRKEQDSSFSEEKVAKRLLFLVLPRHTPWVNSVRMRGLMAVQKGAIRKRDAERTRHAILTAARREFAQHGYLGARIEKIVKAADCNIRLLYHHFGNKRKLYLTILEDAYQHIRAEEAKLAFDPARPLEGLLELLDFTFDYFQKNPTFEGLLRAENMMRGKFVKQSTRVPEQGFPLVGKIQSLIDAGQRQGVLRNDLDAVDLYVTITALSRFHLANAFSLSALLGTDLTRPEWRQKRLERSRQLFRAYLTDRTN
jgi:AcrR family transcriptional regulator